MKTLGALGATLRAGETLTIGKATVRARVSDAEIQSTGERPVSNHDYSAGGGRLMHAGRMIYALARHFDWFRNRMMTEWYIDGGQADLIFISKAGYVTEIEVKISRADWKKDATKEKWRAPRPHIARFFYAVPTELLNAGLPDWLPPDAGVLVVHDGGLGHDFVQETRAARRFKAQKLNPPDQQHILERCYARFWWWEMRRLGGSISHAKARERAAA